MLDVEPGEDAGEVAEREREDAVPPRPAMLDPRRPLGGEVVTPGVPDRDDLRLRGDSQARRSRGSSASGPGASTTACAIRWPTRPASPRRRPSDRRRRDAAGGDARCLSRHHDQHRGGRPINPLSTTSPLETLSWQRLDRALRPLPERDRDAIVGAIATHIAKRTRDPNITATAVLAGLVCSHTE